MNLEPSHWLRRRQHTHGMMHGKAEKNPKNKMVRHLPSQFHFRNTIKIVGDSDPLTLCAPRDERYVCCPSSLPLLGAMARLVCSGAAAPPRVSELLVERLHPSRLAKWDRFELSSSARARLKWRSTDGRDITPSNTLSFGAKALSTTIEQGGESEVAVPPVVSSCTL